MASLEPYPPAAPAPVMDDLALAAAATAPNHASDRLVAAIDQGTSSSRFLVFSTDTSELVTYHQVEIKKIYPNEGWVEQDPNEILDSVLKCIEVVAKKLPELGFGVQDIRCVGLTNQRESTILWDRDTGQPLYNSIVWLDNRTSELVENVIDHCPGRDMNWLKSKTGLPISTYFSAMKIRWLLENVEPVRAALARGTLMFGTVDCWLLWKLTGNHLTDVTNASRTLLMDLDSLQWDPWLCQFLRIPMTILPEIRASAAMYGAIRRGPLQGIPITGVIGDQNAALVGQKCLSIGQTKVTYGTGAFLMQNIGPGPLHGAYKNVPEEARQKLLTTVAFKLGDQLAWYALEGSIAIAGAAITWLRDNLQLVDSYGEVEELARMDDSSGGLYFVPAFQGLYAPYWDPYASGLIIGISQFSRKCHLVRATLEGVAFQTNDILSLMRNGLQYGIRVDGGMSSNDLLCQILADVTGQTIMRARMTESTALGAAMVASYHCGLWHQFLEANATAQQPPLVPAKLTVANGHGPSAEVASLQQRLRRQWSTIMAPVSAGGSQPLGDQQLQAAYDLFTPELEEAARDERVRNWRSAVQRSRKWIRIEQQEQKKIEYLRLSTLPITFFLICSVGLCIISKSKAG